MLFVGRFAERVRCICLGPVGTSLRNVYRAPGPLPELDFDAAVQQAEEIYRNGG